MRKKLPVMLIAVSAALIFSVIQGAGCVSGHGNYISVAISGYVRSAEDSSGVPGALIIAEGQPTDKTGVYTDSQGRYSYSRSFSRDGDMLRLSVTAVDIDGEANGLFVSRDSTIIEDNMEDVLSISFRLNFYVTMLNRPRKGS